MYRGCNFFNSAHVCMYACMYVRGVGSTSSDAMLLEDVPVEHSIIFERLSLEQIAEYSLQKSEKTITNVCMYVCMYTIIIDDSSLPVVGPVFKA